MNAQDWDKFYNNNGRFYLLPHVALQGFMQELKAIAAINVLDLGCGSGRHLVALAKEGFNVEGLDFSPAAVRTANSWLESLDLLGRAVVGDLHEKLTGFKDEEFDAVIAVNSLNYQSSSNFLKSIYEINRLLKTGGMALIVLPSKEAIIKNSEHEQIFMNEEAIRVALKDHLEIKRLDLDEDKNYVIIAQESKKA